MDSDAGPRAYSAKLKVGLLQLERPQKGDLLLSLIHISEPTRPY